MLCVHRVCCELHVSYVRMLCVLCTYVWCVCTLCVLSVMHKWVVYIYVWCVLYGMYTCVVFKCVGCIVYVYEVCVYVVCPVCRVHVSHVRVCCVCCVRICGMCVRCVRCVMYTWVVCGFGRRIPGVTREGYWSVVPCRNVSETSCPLEGVLRCSQFLSSWNVRCRSRMIHGQ